MIPSAGKTSVPIICALATYVLCGCGFPFFSSHDPSVTLHQLGDSYINGKHVDGTPLPESTGEARATFAAESSSAVRAGKFLDALDAIDTTQLRLEDRIDWILLSADMQRSIRDLELRSLARSPGRYLSLGSIEWVVGGDRIPTDEEWRSVISTLNRAPTLMETGRRQLNTPPPLWVRLAINTADRYCNYLDTSFAGFVSAKAPEPLRDSLLAASAVARGALEQHRKYLRDTIIVGRDESWAVGESYYNWLLQKYHLLPYTAESMIVEGRRVHEATKRALEGLARRTEPGRTWQELVVDMKQIHPEPGTIAEAYRRESDRAQELIRGRSMITIPPAETLIFVPTPPALRETYAWGGYGGIDTRGGIMTGRFFVTDIAPGMTQQATEEKLRTQNTGWITPIALHEGYPGHHLQSVYARLHPHAVRSRFGSTYFGEGWALYCESWMGREGFFIDRWDSLGWLQMRLWRTARVIIDPSIHTGRMTYAQAVQFFIDEVGLERSAAEAEVNRYTTWPTQAPSYIIGWLEIERLKRDLQRAQGDDFTERKFAESLLRTGSLPPALMRRALLGETEP